MDTNPIKVGDVVQLRCGSGPMMTVDEIDDSGDCSVSVVWWDGAGFETDRLPLVVLVRVDPKEGRDVKSCGC